MKKVLTILFFLTFFSNSAYTFEFEEIDAIAFNCTNADGSTRTIEYEKGGLSSNKKMEIEKILYDSKWDIVRVHFLNEVGWFEVDNVMGLVYGLTGEMLDFTCSFEVPSDNF